MHDPTRTLAAASVRTLELWAYMAKLLDRGSSFYTHPSLPENIKSAKVQAISPLDIEKIRDLSLISLGLGFFFSVLALVNLLVLPRSISLSSSVMAVGTAAILMVIQLTCSRKVFPVSWVKPCGGVILLLAFVNALLPLFTTLDPRYTIGLVLLFTGAGFWVLSDLVFITLLAGGILGWGICLRLSSASADWLYFGFALLSGILLSGVMHMLRLRSAQQFMTLKDQEAQRKSELENVLVSTEEAQRSLATSMAIGQRITSILDLDVLLNQVAGLIKESIRCSYVGIFLLDESAQYAVARAVTGEAGNAQIREGFRLKIREDGIVGWVAKTRRLACVDDISSDSRFAVLDSFTQARSELALPLVMGSNLLGVLDMQSERLAAFGENDVNFLQLLADQIAIALTNASLYQGEKSRRRLAEMLYNVGRALSGTLNLVEVLDLILEHLAEMVRYDRAAVMLDRGDILQIAAARGFPAGSQSLSVPFKGNDVFNEIRNTQKLLHLPDVSRRVGWQHVPGLPHARAWLGLPLICENSVFGMLSLTRETPDPFSEDEIALASTFAGQAAVALENVRLYDEVRRLNQDLEDRVRQRTEALQAAFNQLERLDKTKSDFISIASHELRTPLTVLQGYTQMLMDEVEIRGNPLHKQLVAGIYSGAVRLHEIVNQLLDAARIDSQALQIHPSPILLSNLIDYVANSLEKAIKERNLTLTIGNLDGLPPVHADLEGLRKVFHQLIVNAIKYTPDGGQISITGRCLGGGQKQLEARAVEIVIADTGIGIDADMQDLIFTRFYQTGTVALHSSGKTKYKGGGPGLGLAIAKGVVEAHGGRIWVESPGFDETACPGSQFHVILPLGR